MWALQVREHGPNLVSGPIGEEERQVLSRYVDIAAAASEGSDLTASRMAAAD